MNERWGCIMKKMLICSMLLLICTSISALAWNDMHNDTAGPFSISYKATTVLYTDGSTSFKLVGQITNNSDKMYNSVSLSFNIYDEKNVQIASPSVWVRNLEAKSAAKFETPFTLPQGTDVRLTTIKLIRVN